MQRIARSFEDLSKLKTDLQSLTFAAEELPTGIVTLAGTFNILRIAFSGHYHESDSLYMSGVIYWATQVWEAQGMLLDLQFFTYDWGDRMQNVFRSIEQNYNEERLVKSLFEPKLPLQFPSAVMVSDLCKTGLESLIQTEMKDSKIQLVESEEAGVNLIMEAWKQPN